MATREKNPEGLRAARAVAQYEIGDANWADLIIDVYLNPVEQMKTLRERMEEA